MTDNTRTGPSNVVWITPTSFQVMKVWITWISIDNDMILRETWDALMPRYDDSGVFPLKKEEILFAGPSKKGYNKGFGWQW